MRQDIPPERVARALGARFPSDRIVVASGHRSRVADEEARVIVFPRAMDELSEILSMAARDRWRVIPMGAGTWLETGNRAQAAHLFVSTAQMNRILEYEPADLTATVEAGCTLASFNAQAAAHRQFIPLDPFGDERATLGAVIATASSGPLRAHYGTPRDWVIGMRIAHADGRVTKAGGKVVKNVAGYDLCKLYTGSYGTLGVIGELSFKLRARPSSDKTIIYEANDCQTLCELAARLLDSDLQPAAVELLGGRRGEEELVERGWGLALRFLAEQETIEAELRDLEDLARGLTGRVLGEEEAEVWWRTYRQQEIAPQWAYSLRLSVLPADLLPMLREVEQLVPEATAISAHAASGVIRLHAESGWLDNLKTAQRPRRLAELRAAAQGRGGQMVILRAPDEIKDRLDVWGDVGPAARLMRELKEKFDPQAILNPGRFVAGI